MQIMTGGNSNTAKAVQNMQGDVSEGAQIGSPLTSATFRSAR